MLTKNIDQMKADVARHIAADAVVAGKYWEAEDNEVGGVGCFIGCLAHSNDPAKLGEMYGLPEPLVRICEQVFERLSSRNPKHGVAFFDAIPAAVGCDGKDLSRVHWAFLAAELRELPKVPANIQAVIDPVIAGMDLLASGQEWPKEAARAADTAAAAAARAAAAAYAARAARAALQAALIRQRDTILRLIANAPVQVAA